MRAGRFADARRGDARFGRPSTVTKERFVAQAPKTTAKGKASAQKKPSSGDEKRVPLKKARQSSADRKAQTSERDEAPVILDARTKRDIAGVVLAVCAIALLLTMILPPSGIVTSFLNDSIRLVLGFGSFLLPFLLGAICACLFVRTDKRYFALRVGAGLSLMIVALLALLALFTPQGDASAAMFSAAELSARGGYVGAGIAWALLKLFGRAVGAIFLAGVLIAGAVVIGFSISDVVDKVRDAAADRARRRREDEEADLSLFATPPVAGVPMGADAPIEDRSVDELLARAETSAISDGARHRGTESSRAAAACSRAHAADAETSKAGTGTPGEFLAPTRVAAEGPGIAACATSRLEPAGRVPRDLSRPRRATMTIRERAREGFDGRARSVDEYWPGEYSFDDGMGSTSDADRHAPSASPTHAFDVPFDENGAADAASFGEFVAPTRSEARAQASGMTRRLSHAPAEPSGQGPGDVPTTRLSAEPEAKRASSSKRRKPKAAATGSSSGEKRGDFVLPGSGLIRRTTRATKADEASLRQTAVDLQGTLEDFGVFAEVVDWIAGPTVTLFKVSLPNGVRVSKVTNLVDDIALSLASSGVRIFAPIPGTTYVGIEVPNRVRQDVLLGDVLKFAKGGPLTVVIGKDVEGHAILSDLAAMPHILIAGTTGSGKSVAINAMIMSILMRATPDEVRFIMVDPKRVEFTPYDGIPHLYVPVVNECKEASSALAWAVAEMERRLKVLSKAGVRNIGQYNEKIRNGTLDEDARDTFGDDQDDPSKIMPYIVIVIDELADLMMNVGKEVEMSISRLAQLARAAGIHMIIATQRPSANVVTGLIKANITNRMALTVASGIDSRVILDETGAENLIGHGDMLYGKPEYPKPVRLQGCYVSNEEIETVVEFLKAQGEPEYHNEILKTNLIGIGQSAPDGSGGTSTSVDPLIWEAADIVVSSGMGSTSNIQRRLSVGYSRAGRIMDMLEEKGVVGPPNGSKPREVLVDELELESLKAFEEHDANDSYGF